MTDNNPPPGAEAIGATAATTTGGSSRGSEPADLETIIVSTGRLTIIIRGIKSHRTIIYVAALFLAAFLVALVPAYILFPPAELVSPFYWILAYSIYASAIAGVTAFLIDIFRKTTSKLPFNWTSPMRWGWYIGITFCTALVALLWSSWVAQKMVVRGPREFLDTIGAEKLGNAALKGMIDPSAISDGSTAERLRSLLDSIGVHKFGEELIGILSLIGNDKLPSVVWHLEILAFLVVFGYFCADIVALLGGGDKTSYKGLLAMDIFVLIIHGAAAAIIWRGGSIVGFRDVPATPREAFMGGFIGLSLLLQSATFSYIMSRPLKIESNLMGEGHAGN